MRLLNRLFPAYPLLIPIYSGLFLYFSNITDVPPADLIRPLLVGVLIAALLLLVCRLVIAQDRLARLVTSGLLLAFFSYGHLYVGVADVQLFGLELGHHRYVLAMMGVALLGWLVISWRWQARAAGFEQWLAAMLAFAVLFTSASILLRSVAAEIAAANRNPVSQSFEPFTGQAGAKPDVLYLVLDGYARADVLKTIYDFDNSHFIAELESLGFVVASDSASNYNQTVLSLASALNMDYLPTLLDCMDCSNIGREQVSQLMKHNLVRQQLELVGYETVAFETGYGPIEWRDADRFVALSGADVSNAAFGYLLGTLTPYESQLIATSALRLAMDSAALRRWTLQELGDMSPYLHHARRVQMVFDSVAEAVHRPGPTFVYAHVISPHPPFVFNAEGGFVPNQGTFNLADGDAFGGGEQEYVERYRQQLQYVNRRVLDSLRRVLGPQEREVVIILQGDHGPGSQLVWDSAAATNLPERFGILNAYRMPEAWAAEIYPSISPVNSFRLLFRAGFGADIDNLPDDSYFSSWDDPLDFLPVSPQVRTGP